MAHEVPEKLDCCGKINLTLHITGQRDDGYHLLNSLFLRTAPLEKLTITHLKGDNVKDILTVTGAELQGINILQRTLAVLRNGGFPIPPLRLELEKTVPPGTGLGYGSGNAAVLFHWLNSQGLQANSHAASIGADIPFFLQDAPLALVSGIGDVITPLTEQLDVKALLVIPTWRCETPQMFHLLDEEGCPFLDETEALSEAQSVLLRLMEGQQVGLLPNDFEPLLTRRHSEYHHFYKWCARQEALAWGISGSGSAAFALWPQEKSLNLPIFEWIDSTAVFSTKKESC